MQFLWSGIFSINGNTPQKELQSKKHTLGVIVSHYAEMEKVCLKKNKRRAPN